MIDPYVIRPGTIFEYYGSPNSPRRGWKGVILKTPTDTVCVRYENGIYQDYTYRWFKDNMRLVSYHSLSVKEIDMYILWNPQSTRPPQKTFITFDEAKRVQKIMEERNKNQTFHIMKLVSEETEFTVNLKGDNKMHQVNLLTIEDKVIEITNKQAQLLGTSGKHYKVTAALKSGNNYFAASEIEVTKLPEEDEE